MVNLTKFIYGCLYFILGQLLVWYQVNGQFLNDWIKNNDWDMFFLGYVSTGFVFPVNNYINRLYE